ncbi:MAG: cupredoxin family copper-binding protein [Candidatus Eremiobacteraeota bacterium]|nr:cupredoxin family copper-binding protein [Candidatus Eremiobacteraeota bacterium]MBV9971806.1 cupredoxin family copper-binding protein [Candidatus Eremiobacteraeota bacterium]
MAFRSVLLIFSIAAVLAIAVAQSGSTAPETSVVHIASFAFKPQALVVHPGDTVTFINDDSVAHTVTAEDKSFDSGNLDQNAKFSKTFDKAGTFKYICTYHPMMKGTIVVKAAE